MEFHKSRTYANLMAAFAGESQARNKYTFYAAEARQAGYRQIADIFEETANNEREHAEIWFKYIHGNKMPDTLEGLNDAAGGEWYEFSEMYKLFAEDAKTEGYNEIAQLFSSVGKIEKEHHDRFEKLAQNINNGIVFKRESIKVWICKNCGHIHTGESAPLACPVCKKPQAYFEIKAETY